MRWLCLLALWPGVTLADWPALYDVTRVSVNDTLNVRSFPDAHSEILGELSPNAQDIEVIDVNEDGRWGLINIGERAGWVSLAFLQKQNRPEGLLPLECYGTEPFWFLSLEQAETVFFKNMDETETSFDVLASRYSANRTDRWFLMAENASASISVVVRSEICSDGMTDRTFGISTDFILQSDAAPRFLSGCCSIAVR